jgi:hypothetical protein
MVAATALEPDRRLWHNFQMPKRPTDADMKARALDRWRNEGGAGDPAADGKHPSDPNESAKDGKKPRRAGDAPRPGRREPDDGEVNR